MKFATILSAFMAGSYAMHVPNTGNKDSLQKRADSDHAFSGTDDTGAKASLADHSKLAVPITRRDVVPLHYIVFFKTGEAESAYKAQLEWINEQLSELQNRGDLPANVARKVYLFKVQNLRGYSSYLPPTLLDEVKKNPMVDFVEEDQIYETNSFTKQKDAPWGVARISQRDNAESADYDYDDQAGNGVLAFVLDSGVNHRHPEFEGRVRWESVRASPAQEDEDGHGTHIAGIIRSKTYGIAKKADLFSLRITNEEGTVHTSDVIKGVEFAVGRHKIYRGDLSYYRGAIINLSIGGPPSDALENTLNAAIDAGVHVVVSAGNMNMDACNFSPARATGPITVGATNANDLRGDYSNWGSCVDVHAPGTDILSTGLNLLSANRSGTSMAAAHVAGIIATFMSLQPNVRSEFGKDALVKPVDLKRMFLRFSTRDVVKGLDQATPNRLAYNGAGLSLQDLWNL